MRHRFVLLAVLLGVALALFAPAQPSGADDVNCLEDIVFDPTLCDDDLPPPDPPPTPSTPARGGMQEMPGGPGMRPGQEAEVCINERNFADPAFIFPERKKIYTFNLQVNYCTRNGVVTRASVIPGLDREAFDPRIFSVTLPVVYRGPTGVGTSLFEQGQDVLTEFCPDLVNCQMYRHFIEVEIRVGDARELRVSPDVIPCGPLLAPNTPCNPFG